MRRWFILGAVAAQVLVLAFMAAQREWVVRTGERILVRTAPIDPRDPMRGDYARLNYEISTVPRELCRDGVAGWFGDGMVYSRDVRDRRVYAVVERDESGIVSLRALTDVEPTSGLFLRGRAEWLDSHAIAVRYGIEAFFMEQGRAIEFENQARYERVGVPINAEVAVSPGGLAVLRSYHWESLGIALRLTRRQASETPGEADITGRARQGLVGAVVTLKNHGDAPVAVVDRPGARSFRLIPAERSDRGYLPAISEAPTGPVAADWVIELEPGQEHDVVIDLTQPSWFIRKKAAAGEAEHEPVAMELVDQGWGSWFRIEYVPPSRAECAGLAHADLIGHARLRSRMFTPAGGAD